MPPKDYLANAGVHHARAAQKLDPQGRDGYDAEYQLRMEFGRRLEAVGQLPGLAIGPAYRIFLREGAGPTRWDARPSSGPRRSTARRWRQRPR